MNSVMIGNNERISRAAGFASTRLPSLGKRRYSSATVVIGISLLGLIGAYVVILYSNFSVSFAIEGNRARAVEIERENRGLELAVQKWERAISEGHEEILGGMEKISTITYLTAQSYAFVHQ